MVDVDRELKNYPEKYDWVKVRSNRKHSLGKRDWNDDTLVPLKEGDTAILPRGSADNDEQLNGMKFYFKNDFYEVLDSDPFNRSGVSEANVSEPDTPEDEGDDEPIEPSEQDVETPNPSVVNEEPDEDEGEKIPEEMSYGELQSWASEVEGVAGNDPKDELVEAYKEKELKSGEGEE